MDYSSLYENKKRGSFDFPIELYYVDDTHPQYQMPLHWHLEYELILVMKGSFELTLEGKTHTLYSGDCAWIGDGVIHGGVPRDCIYECVVFDLGRLLKNTPICRRNADEFIADETGHTCVFKKGCPQGQLADKIFEAMEKEQKGYEWITVGLLWQLMAELLREKNFSGQSAVNRSKAMRMKKVLTFIRENYENPITLDELSAVAKMAPRYFCRAFSEMTGKTPIAYLNYYRIEQAGERLLLTDDSVTDIALSCGFNDMSYFSKMFARHKGVSPSVYRKRG